MDKTNKKRIKIENKGYIIRNIVTLLAAVNLVLLFVFNYNVPGISNIITKIENRRDHIEGIQASESTSDNNVTFEYEEDTFVYTGKGPYQPRADVTVRDLAGNELDKQYLSTTVIGESDKEIVYTYESPDGLYYGTQNRPIKLENYSAPVIVLTGEIGKINDSNLSKIKKLCAGKYNATNGYGKDATDKVEITAEPTADYDGTFKIIFTLVNIFGDTAVSETTTKTAFDLPHLKLTETEISIERGKKIDPLSYVKYAVDADGSNIMDLVEYTSNVDEQTLGDYTIKYDLSNEEGVSIKTRTLKVHVISN